MKNIIIKGLEDGDLSKYSIKKLGQIEGGRTSGTLNAESGVLSKAGRISATKQWKENRDGELEKASMGGKKAVETKTGVHSLSKKELAKAGKKGYQNGLGKLSIKQKLKIASNAGLANREKISSLKPNDVIYMRKNFIARDKKFGVVAFSKKYNTTEQAIRNAIKGRTFKDIK
jgi:hypothetical protein